MKKILSFLTLICVLNVLIAAGLLAYLVATGRMDKAKGGAIVDLVRHQGTPPKFREQLYEILEPATSSAPASRGAGGSSGGVNEGEAQGVSSASERISFARRALEQQQLALDSRAQELRHQQELLEKLKDDLEARAKKIDDTKKESEPKAASAESKAREENFQKSLALYDELKPKQVKDLFMDGQSEETVASYLVAMEVSRAGKIIGEFKAPEERKFVGAVLERIRNNGTGAALLGSTEAASTAAGPATMPGVVQ